MEGDFKRYGDPRRYGEKKYEIRDEKQKEERSCYI